MSLGSRFKSLSQMSGARGHHGDLGLGFKVEKALVNGVFMQKQARKAQNLP